MKRQIEPITASEWLINDKPVHREDWQTFLTNRTLSMLDCAYTGTRIECLHVVYSGWFGFGRALGWRALVINETSRHSAESDICRTPYLAVRNALETLLRTEVRAPL